MNNKCPLCGKEKRAAKDLVCAECYQLWVAQAGHALASEGKVIPFTIWAFEKVKGVLYPLREELEKMRTAYQALEHAVGDAAYAAITTALGGKRVEPEVFRLALKEKRDALWKEKGGNRLHFELKTKETRLAFLQGLYEELREKVEKPEEPPTTEVTPPPTPEEAAEILKEPKPQPEEPDPKEDDLRPRHKNHRVRERAAEKAQLNQMVRAGGLEDKS